MKNTEKKNIKHIPRAFAVFILAILCVVLAFSLISCADVSSDNLDGSAMKTNPEKYIQLGNYKGIEVDNIDTTVTDADVDSAITETFGTAVPTDEMVVLVTESKYTTFDEYRTALKEELIEQKEYQAKTTQLTQALEKINETSTFTNLIEGEIQAYVKDVEDYYMSSNDEGLTIEEFINNNFPVTYEQFQADTRAEAEESIKNQVIIYAVAKAEGLELTDEIYNKYASMYAERYSYTVAEIEELLTKEAVEENAYRDMVFDFILENTVKK